MAGSPALAAQRAGERRIEQRVGIEAAIYEAYDTPAYGVGSFMNVATNGLDGLRTLGAHERVQAAAFPTSQMVMSSGTGKRLGQVENGTPLPDEAASRGIHTEYTSPSSGQGASLAIEDALELARGERLDVRAPHRVRPAGRGRVEP